MEADFQRYYRIDLGQAAYGKEGRCSARRLLNLYRALPAEAASNVRGQEAKDGWNLTTFLLGMLVEQLDSLRHITVAAAGGKPKGKPLEIVPRPKVAPQSENMSTVAALDDLDAMFEEAG